MNTRKKIWNCLAMNVAILMAVFAIVFVFKDPNSKYFRFGPNEDLFLISVKIDTWSKYFVSLFTIGIIRIGEVIVKEIGSPILGFNVYNPDKKVITDFTKNELNFLANTMYFVNGLRGVCMVVISISQIDIALISVIVSEITSIWTVRLLLNEKSFEDDQTSPSTVAIAMDNTNDPAIQLLSPFNV